ncbi:T-cell surface glycoprotein CD3 zeta chain isoform X1 [Gouania willdenowi]|uniref:T-cell surface glycoprotein CD3 zeta chain isoform X1 n=1 Tax=Gouania willdenowi TaxID=441366 RepID=UPI001054304E|nr:T-cell surface glycoprotein CD3 zeta chain isoform X1 [Gouania willdenowi]
MMMMMMKVWVSVLIVCFVQSAEATTYDPKLCYILDGFLGIYGLFITGMFIKEKFFRSKVKEDRMYKERGAEEREVERGGRLRRPVDDPTYTDLNKHSDREYRELPNAKRHKKNNPVYQDLSSATRDTYHTLQMQPLSVR